MSIDTPAFIRRRILKISLPLVASLGATTVMEFTDRLFLAQYSLDSIAAATPAGIMALLAMTIFMGTASYVSVFVAQYVGQGRCAPVGRVVWQGIYIALLGAVVMAGLALFAKEIFALSGHAVQLQELETIYFRILCQGAGIHLLGTALGGFFTGQGRTRVVMVANIVGMALNIPLDYCLINGVGFFPEWGIFGAGLATVISWTVITMILGLAALRNEHAKFRLLADWGFRLKLWLRLLRYGLPSGIEFFVDILGFTAFVLIVGRLGTVELATTNIALNINSLAFMPLIGFSMGVSTLVGQAMGAGRPDDVPLIVRTSLMLSFSYLAILAMTFLLIPDLIIGLFQSRNMDTASFAAVVATGRVLLMIVVAYLFFDGVSFIIYAALKGAGDTMFVMTAHLVLIFTVMFPPLLAGIYFNYGLYYFWLVMCTFLIVLSFVGWCRYRQGKWRNMLVVERSGARPQPEKKKEIPCV